MSTWNVFRPAHTAHPFALTMSNEHTMLVSGLGGYAPDGSISESPREQAEQALRTMNERLARGGFSLDEVVWFRPYATDIAYVAEMDEALRAAFGAHPPACGAMIAGVQLADPRMKIEFEAMAVKGARRQSDGEQ